MNDEKTRTLSGEPALQTRKRSATDALVIRKQKGKVLSKEQRTFNRLTRRIATLEQKMTSDRARLDALMEAYRAQVAPAETERAQVQLELVRALAAASGRVPLQKRQKADLREMILDLFDEILAVIKPDAELEALYDEWSEVSYREEVRQEAEQLKRRTAQALRDEYDIKMDVSGYDDTPEAIARFMENARRQMREAEASRPREAGRRRRRAVKQEDHEAVLREREAITKKSVRDIYLAVAKVLHPDAVTDAAERSLREEFMKQATLAYRQGDIAALLKLELRWVTRDDKGTNALGDEVLRAYIPALHEQLARLERALSEQIFDPHYRAVSPVMALPERTALGHIRDRANALRADAKFIERQVAFAKACHAKRDLTAFVYGYFRAREADVDWEAASAAPSADLDDWD